MTETIGPEERIIVSRYPDGTVIAQRRNGSETDVLSFEGEIQVEDGVVSISGNGDEGLKNILAAAMGAKVSFHLPTEGKKEIFFLARQF